MLTQTGEVVTWQDGVARVRVQRFAGCGRCQLRQGCGVGTLERAFPGSSLELSMPAEVPLHPGERVTIGLRESTMLGAASLVYLLPLLLLILALVVGGVGLFVEALRWVLIIALVLLILGAVTGARGRRAP